MCFFVKQKTAYVKRISDLSSDVCSSDLAMSLLDSAVPPMDAAANEPVLALGMRMADEHGLTGVHDAGVSLQPLRAYQALAERGEMPLRRHRSEERRGGTTCVSTGRSRWLPVHLKKNKHITSNTTP